MSTVFLTNMSIFLQIRTQTDTIVIYATTHHETVGGVCIIDTYFLEDVAPQVYIPHANDL